MLFGHSADHINFFSAREKFKGMSQDGKSHCAAAVQQSPQLKSCGKEQQPLPQGVPTGEGKEEVKDKVRRNVGDQGLGHSYTLHCLVVIHFRIFLRDRFLYPWCHISTTCLI